MYLSDCWFAAMELNGDETRFYANGDFFDLCSKLYNIWRQTSTVFRINNVIIQNPNIHLKSSRTSVGEAKTWRDAQLSNFKLINAHCIEKKYLELPNLANVIKAFNDIKFPLGDDFQFTESINRTLKYIATVAEYEGAWARCLLPKPRYTDALWIAIGRLANLVEHKLEH